MTSPKVQSIWAVDPVPMTASLTRAGDLQVQLAWVGGVAVRLEFVGGHQVRTKRDTAVLALALSDTQLAFHLLQVARGPVVEDGVADDRLFGLLDGEILAAGPDHRGDLQFEVLPSTSGRRRRVVIGP
ncbi:hypothetical protein MTY59_28610 [Mycobacterium senriense]|uniref:Uncharacterized protein n=1 Tax=Mycobacterium senriense TaxID=2775496 RepID=A0ABN6IKV6_9MYCO|nr:hypothetical protein MTY59_28610 [Mycobacterium senriense]